MAARPIRAVRAIRCTRTDSAITRPLTPRPTVVRGKSASRPFNGFPWPSTGQIAAAEKALADERDRRDEQKRRVWADLGLPGDPPPGDPISDAMTVSIVLWSLRGQR